jgi:hypothetical protein
MRGSDIPPPDAPAAVTGGRHDPRAKVDRGHAGPPIRTVHGVGQAIRE